MKAEASDQASGALTSPDRLRKIDQLREKNIGAYLPLPQLVAVGDQSSGKSSLLESLTGIPFPRGLELCTRYATQITHRRDDKSGIRITIIPGPHASAADKQRLEGYQKHVQSVEQLHLEFPQILEEVNTQMDIRSVENPTGCKTFSEDILKVERYGPTEDYLTVIDVPGIFRNTTEGLTTVEDRALIVKMVKNYIQDHRTIILAVLPCYVDLATQEILTFAEEVDKTGERTLGILTKPDLLYEENAKAIVCDLVNGKKRPLNLGYYLVRSRGGDDSNLEDRSIREREMMFNEKPWSTLPADRVGVKALRETLQELLGQITDKAFPKLRAETRQLLTETREKLTKLGPPRRTEREQQQYLVAMASNFQAIVRAGLDASYSVNGAFCDKDLRLITAVINTTESFGDDFLSRAHTYRFESASEESAPEESPPWTSEEQQMQTTSNDESSQVQGTESDGRSETGHTGDFDLGEFPDLMGLIFKDFAPRDPLHDIMAWITQAHRTLRGPELGTFGPHLLINVFQEQTVQWAAFTKHYLGKIVVLVHRFILAALEVVCEDSGVREELLSNIIGELLKRYTEGRDHAIFLVNVERGSKPYTLNHYFNSNLQHSRGARMRRLLATKAREEKKHGFGPLVFSLDDIQAAVSNKSNADFTTEEVHDILHAYYKVARKRFIDNVYRQAVDHHLLSGPTSPLNVFTEQWVLQLEAEKLNSIAGESRATKQRRSQLEQTLQDLEEAIKILS